MIERKQLQRLIDTVPFQMFVIETSGGNHVVVQSADHIKLPPKGFDLVIVFGSDGLVHYLTEESIINLAVYGPEPASP